MTRIEWIKKHRRALAYTGLGLLYALALAASNGFLYSQFTPDGAVRAAVALEVIRGERWSVTPCWKAIYGSYRDVSDEYPDDLHNGQRIYKIVSPGSKQASGSLFLVEKDGCLYSAHILPDDFKIEHDPERKYLPKTDE